MRKNFLLLFLLAFSLPIFANLNGNGYYRVQNYYSNRWITIVDNTGNINWTATTADLKAMQLIKDTDMILGDAGSILYITNTSGSEYDVAAQGTSVKQIMSYSIKLRKDGSANGEDLYRAYGTYEGVTKYLRDANRMDWENYGEADLSSTTSTPNTMKWYIKPVDANSDNYFGVVPTVNINNDYYATLYTSFPYQPVSSNIKAYYIGRTGCGMAELIEVKDAAVAAQTPVIIKCAGENITDNKMNVGASASQVNGNSLKGTYFNCHIGGHQNFIAYDKNTMRVLGKCADGSLGFITANLDYIPANSAYLLVEPNSPAELRCVTTQYFDENYVEVTNPDNFYLIGSFQNWNINDNSYILKPDNNLIYTGTFKFPLEGEDISFRFYSELGDLNKNSFGANSNVSLTVNFNDDGYYQGEVVEDSKGNWIIEKWNGQEVSFQLDYENMTLTILTTLLPNNPDDDPNNPDDNPDDPNNPDDNPDDPNNPDDNPDDPNNPDDNPDDPNNPDDNPDDPNNPDDNPDDPNNPDDNPDDPDSGINGIAADSNGLYRVYNLEGANITNTSDKSILKTLKKGIYIINGKKIIITK